jgi:hypothetical protein
MYFSVSASDPDGDTLSYQWTLDGSYVASGSSYTDNQGYTDGGSNSVKVTVSDPGGLSTSKTWTVTVIDVPLVIQPSGSSPKTYAGKPFSTFTTVDEPSEYSSTTQFGQVDWLLTSDTSLRGYVWFNLSSLPSGCTVTDVRIIFNSFIVYTDSSNYSDTVTVYSGPLSVTTTEWNGSTLAARFGYGRSSTLSKSSISYYSHPQPNDEWVYSSSTTRANVQAKAGQFICWRFDIGSTYLDLSNTAQGGDSWRGSIVVTLKVTYEPP